MVSKKVKMNNKDDDDECDDEIHTSDEEFIDDDEIEEYEHDGETNMGNNVLERITLTEEGKP
jgi:hypothetical protein